MPPVRLLLVEDEIDLLFLLKNQVLFSDLDAEVDTALTLDEARAKLGTSWFDAVLLDLVLGNQSGWTLVDEIAAAPNPRPCVVVISGYVGADTRERAAAARCEWLPKPYSSEELSSVLRRVLHERLSTDPSKPAT